MGLAGHSHPMRFEDDATTFTRRGLVLGVSQVALFSLLAGRLQYLQVARSDLYATLAEDNRVNVRLMAPPRGQIFDRNKIKLADNDQDFQVVLIPEQAGDLDATVAKLSQLLDFSDRQQKDLLRRARLVAAAGKERVLALYVSVLFRI